MNPNSLKNLTPKFGFKKGHSTWNKGKNLSEEHRKKLSLSHKGKNLGNTNGFKKGMTAWNKGMKGYNSGEDHPRWVKDRSLLKRKDERMDAAYHCWERDVKRRDKYKCRINNCDCSGKVIAHHILPWRDYPELRYDINNGIALCKYHHPIKRQEEFKMIPVFQGYIMRGLIEN